MNEVYANFPIRDQDSDVRSVSDLLQGWGGPARGSLRARLRRGLRGMATWLSREGRTRRSHQADSSCWCSRVS